MRFFEDIVNILFPNLCCTCNKALTRNEELICFHCRSELPKTLFDDFIQNDLTDRFYGKFEISFGVSLLYFYKTGITQNLLHQFKYNNYPEIGEMIGGWLAHQYLKRQDAKQIDVIIPVPLHPRKERIRGYNQSQYFARGISEVIDIPTDFTSLVRTQYQKSQTHKTKEQRWKSVENAFKIIDPQKIENKKVLIVDDVITTGATLEACGHQLVNSGASEIGIATMALAK